MIKISPSVLSADFANMERDVKLIEKAGCPYVHIDVMDGHFVPNITFGPAMVQAISRVTDMTLDVHLMISEPEKYIDAFLDAGADIITVHAETGCNVRKIAEKVRNCGKKFAVAINPPTDSDTVLPYADILDMILVMSVNPGFGAQAFIEPCLDKIKYLRSKFSGIDIEVDGGIKMGNVQRVVDAGANVIVAGSAIFGADDVTAAAHEFIKRCNEK